MSQAIRKPPATTIEPEMLARVHEIMTRPYRLVLTPLPADDGGGFFIAVPDLPGRWSDGETPGEAYAHIQDAMEGWLASALESGDEIPEPRIKENLPSGKFMVRLPRSLHQRLRARAQAEDVSLNQLLLSFIAAGMGSTSGASTDGDR